MTNYNNVLSFLIPTNNPEALKTKFYTCLDVFDNFKQLITFCFNFQPPYTEEIISEVVDYLTSRGYQVCCTFNEYNWTPATFSFITMRNDAAKVAPKDTLYFVDFDDDIEYYPEYTDELTTAWLEGIYFLLSEPNVGSFRIDTRVYQGKKAEEFADIESNRIYYLLKGMYGRTGLGLVYKNIYNGQVLPDKQLSLKGSREDLLEILQRIADGYLCSFVILDNGGEHTDNKKVLSRYRYGLDAYYEVKGYIGEYLHRLMPLLMHSYAPINELGRAASIAYAGRTLQDIGELLEHNKDTTR